MKVFIFFAVIFLLHQNVFSQQLSGFVYTDSSNTAMEFAAVSLYKSADSLPLSVVTTDATGFYKFSALAAGNYRLQVTMMGFENVVQSFQMDSVNVVRSIVLRPESSKIEEVVILKKKSVIQQEAGKTTVDVKSMSAATGLMAIDLLRKMPGVTVDNDGNIALKGKPNVAILLDGKMTNMSAKQITSILQSMLASEIDNIEIITAPSAKYDAQGDGGIININLKKSTKKGFYGNFQATYGQGILPKSNSGVNLSFNAGKWKFRASYSINANKNRTHGFNNRNFGALSSGLLYNQSFTYVVPSVNHSYAAGADYKVNSKLDIGVSHNGMFMHDIWNGAVDGAVIDSSQQVQQLFTTKDHVPWQGTSYSNNVDFKYKLDSTGTLSGGINYMHYHDLSNQSLRVSRSASGVNAFADLTSTLAALNNNVTGKVDYEKAFFKKMKIESGAKWMYNTLDNSIDFTVLQSAVVVPSTPSKKLFSYQEQVSAAYVQGKWSEKKWQYQSGLRAEYWHAKGEELLSKTVFTRDYLQFFPSAFVSYQAAENHSWSFSYNRRIQRPNSHMLAPVSYFDDPYFLYSGNPTLLPQLSHNVELSHSFKDGRLISTVSYMHSDN